MSSPPTARSSTGCARCPRTRGRWRTTTPSCAVRRGGHYMTQPLVELYGGCMVALKVSRCRIAPQTRRGGRPRSGRRRRTGPRRCRPARSRASSMGSGRTARRARWAGQSFSAHHTPLYIFYVRSPREYMQRSIRGGAWMAARPTARRAAALAAADELRRLDGEGRAAGGGLLRAEGAHGGRQDPPLSR